MKCFCLNENNDIFIENNQLKILSDVEAVAQVAMNVVQTTFEEIVLHPERGIPYFQLLFNNRPKIQLLTNYMNTELKKVKGVNSVSDINIFYDKDKNLLKYSLDLDTIYGKVVTNG